MKKPRKGSGEPNWSPCFLLAFLSVPPCPPNLSLLLSSFSFLVGMWIGYGKLRQIGWPLIGVGSVRPRALGRTKDPSKSKTVRKHPHVRHETTCKIHAPRLRQDSNQKAESKSRDYKWGMGSGWEQGVNNQKGPKNLPLTGHNIWVTMLDGLKGPETGTLQPRTTTSK